MSREYSHSVDLPRTNTPFALKEAINAAITSYSSEDERDIVPRPPRQTKHTSKSKRSPLSTIPSQSIVPTVLNQSSSTTSTSKTLKPSTTTSTASEETLARELVPPSPTAEKLRNESIAITLGLGHLPDAEFTEYTVWNASLSNLRVCPIDLTCPNPIYYYVENRAFIPSHPGVTLHLGSDKTAPIIAVAHLDYFSTKNLLGLGDPKTNPMGMKWEKLHKDSFWTHMRYSFSYDFGLGEGEATRFGDHSGVRKFEWHRTKFLYMVLDQPDLVLVEEGTHDVYAQYKGGNFGQVQKQRGVLKVKKGMDQGWERMVVLSWASIVELTRRRTRERRVTALFGRVV